MAVESAFTSQDGTATANFHHPAKTSGCRGDLDAIPARLLTVAEVSELLAVSRGTIYRLMESGQITSIKVGGSRRIEPTAVEQFLAVCRSAS
jgi:excisionase family DNA binding protein